MKDAITVPMRTIGPVRITGPELQDEITVPLATFESPLWPSTNRGASVTRRTNGLTCVIIDERMSRSVLVQAPDVLTAKAVADALPDRRQDLEAVVEGTSRFARLKDWHIQIVGNLLYLRLELSTGDASGHNMVTKAADAVLGWLLKEYTSLQYVSISANYCIDKKASAVNGILGRGKYVVAEMLIPRAVCEERLKTTPEAIVDLHIKKNLLGTMLAGGLRSANAHFANILLAFYLATGQDAANIVEGSQGMVHAECRGQDLYFSITLPHAIVGTTGSGKHLDFAREHLQQMGCLDEREPGENARRLALILAATVWCGELSLLAAQTNPGELMRAHEKFERSHTTEQEPVTR